MSDFVLEALLSLVGCVICDSKHAKYAMQRDQPKYALTLACLRANHADDADPQIRGQSPLARHTVTLPLPLFLALLSRPGA